MSLEFRVIPTMDSRSLDTSEFDEVEVYDGVIDDEINPPLPPECFLGAWYRKVFSSKDYWLGIEGKITLGEFIPDEERFNLDGNKIGLIKSDQLLYDLIDKEQKDIKDKYGVDKVYPPSGLEVQRVNTYNTKLTKVEKIYEEIKDLEPFTIEGYQVTVSNKDDKSAKSFFILNKEDLDIAIDNTVTSFLTEEEYSDYLNGTYEKNEEEGKEITNVYFDQEVTIKKTYISTEEEILTNAEELSMYFL